MSPTSVTEALAPASCWAMIVVLPTCSKDVHIAQANLSWCLRLDKKADFDCIILAESGTNSCTLTDLCGAYFRTVKLHTYDAWKGDQKWPAPQNYAWQTAARLMPQFKEPWFWWEADATPLQYGWLRKLADAYTQGGQPFMGHVVASAGHMNGVAVYPPQVSSWDRDCFLTSQAPFDVVLSRGNMRNVFDASHLIGHRVRHTGTILSVHSRDVAAKLAEKYVLYHGINDGSLLALLSGSDFSFNDGPLVRVLTLADIGREADDAESFWQQDAAYAVEHGRPILPYHECIKEQPSFIQQTKYPAGLFSLPLDGKECHFNPGLVDGPDGLVLVTRRFVPDREGGNSTLVAWSLDSTLYPSNPRPLQFGTPGNTCQFEDPRVFWTGTHYAVAHCFWRRFRLYRAHQTLTVFDRSWNRIAELNVPYGGNGWQPGSGSGHEKNWVWFQQDRKFHFVYCIAPHVVIRMDGSGIEHSIHKTGTPAIDWPYGDPHGGTPPVKVGNEYISFFHSSLPWKGRQKRYYMGAYAFEAKAPFKVTRYTREALLIGSEKDTRIYGGPLCIFPGGAVLKREEWLIVGGCNDESCFWWKPSHKELVKLLKPA